MASNAFTHKSHDHNITKYIHETWSLYSGGRPGWSLAYFTGQWQSGRTRWIPLMQPLGSMEPLSKNSALISASASNITAH